jgi:hypothetical protein
LMVSVPVVAVGDERLGLTTPPVFVIPPVIVPLPSTLPPVSVMVALPGREMNNKKEKATGKAGAHFFPHGGSS